MSKKAFTLVELAVVLLVIGILAGLLLRNLGGFTSTARDQRRIGDLRNTITYLTAYYTKNGSYPTATDWNTLESQLRAAGVLGAGSSLPRDPSGLTPYLYAPCTSTPGTNVNTNPTNFIIAARLESTRDQARALYEGTVTTTPSGWSCPSASTFISNCNDNYYCLAY